MFPSYGLPEEIVTDNGLQFISTVFKTFLRQNGVKQTLVPPYHLALNEAAERSVQILKRSLEKQVLQKRNTLSMSHHLENFLFAYRSTPNTCLNVFETFVMNSTFPNLAEIVENQQRQQKKNHDSPTSKLCEFTIGDKVQVQVLWKDRKMGKWNN